MVDDSDDDVEIVELPVDDTASETSLRTPTSPMVNHRAMVDLLRRHDPHVLGA